jgi:hypothetical protein
MLILCDIFICDIYLTNLLLRSFSAVIAMDSDGSPAECIAACCLLTTPKSISKLHHVHTHIRTSEPPNEHNFDPDDKISSESELDTETPLLYLLCPVLHELEI